MTPDRRKRSSRRLVRSAPAASPRNKSAPRVVTLDWRLPARLRRPVREELARQRRQAKQRQAIVQFERRPIYSELPTSYPNYRGAKKTEPKNIGVEHHTGDVYMHSRPTVALDVPPYAGRVVRQAVAKKPAVPARPTTPPRRRLVAGSSKRSSLQGARLNKPAQPPRAVPRFSATAKSAPRLSATVDFGSTGVRDVPYQWPKLSTVSPHEAVAVMGNRSSSPPGIRPPKRRFALPLHFSVFPLNLLPSRRKKPTIDGAVDLVESSPGKKKLPKVTRNLLALGLLCAVTFTSFFNLQGIGRGQAAAGSITNRARGAYQQLLTAQQALAERDFGASESAFASASAQLHQAQEELHQALAASRIILETLDVTGTLRSGQQLLVAGEEVTAAGQRVSRGLAYLMKADVLPSSGPTTTVVDALGNALDEFSQADLALGRAEKALADIEASALPDDIQPHVVRLQAGIPILHKTLTQFLDASSIIMNILGSERERQYLLLFQNNHEIRPTGGFIGTIALVNVDRGAVENINVQSVYDGDGQLQDYIAPPNPLLPITNRWYLRDANWFIDFPTSAQKISTFLEKETGPTVDGVIALTPEVVRQLLMVTGPIEVPGYGLTVDADNFILLTQDQVTYNYDHTENRPKQFLADLTPLLLNRLFNDPARATLPLLRTLRQMLREKHLLLYFRDEGIQSRVHASGWDGGLPVSYDDFLSVNNANIGGHKSDQFIEQEIEYEAEVNLDGDIDAVVTIRRTHRGPEETLDYPYPPGDNPAHKNNIVYQRVLVPNGAELQDAQGFTTAGDIPRTTIPETDVHVQPDADVVEWQREQRQHASGTVIGREAGFQYFANWQITKPGETTIGVYRYRLPQHIALPSLADPAERYSLYVAKQPGDTRTMIRTKLRLPQKYTIVHTVPHDGITPEANNVLIYRGALRADTLVGAVFAKQ